MKFFLTFAALVAVAAAGRLNINPDAPIFSPALVDLPAPNETPVIASPVVIGDIPEGSSPLVQIIINVANSDSFAPAPAPGVVGPDGVSVVDLPVSGVAVADLPAPPVGPVVIGAPQLPVAPVIIGTPEVVPPVVALPEQLN